MTEAIVEIVINAGIAHGFLMALIIANNRDINGRFWLTLLLINISLIVFRINYLMYYLIVKVSSHLFLTGPFLFLLCPLLFLYLRSIVEPERKFSLKDSWHFALAIVYLLTIIPLWYFGYQGEYIVMPSQVVDSPRIILILQFGYYLFLTQRTIKVYKEQIVQGFSNVEGLDISWMNAIFWFLVVTACFIAITAPGILHGMGFPFYQKWSALFFSVLCFFVAQKGIHQRHPPETDFASAGAGYPDIEIDERLKERLLNHMQGKKPYLKPELTLTELAAELSLSRNQLSFLINKGMGENFYNFVNRYRVEEVKRLIDDDVRRRYNIMSLAEDAGFNSKSTFNSIFKKVTGMTPSQYREGRHQA